jgi:ketosteroid isomerase-like protein
MQKFAFVVIAFLFYHVTVAQDTLQATIIQKDSLFWQAYNNCDTAGMMKYVAADIEFFHDKGGITRGRDALAMSFARNICSQRDSFHLRRQAVPASIRLYPMQDGDKAYGMVISGDHLFYVGRKGKKEHAEGLAKFFHLWVFENGEWRMKRIISYDHQPAPYTNERVIKPVANAVLQGYAGSYTGAQSGTIVVKPGKGSLTLQMGGKQFLVFPESEAVFFLKDRDVTFEFVKKGGKVVKMIVRERGEEVEALSYSGGR